MKKRILLLTLLLPTLTLFGCDKLIKPQQASPYTESYKNKLQDKQEYIEGDTTLELGDYVVYSDDGRNCKITSGGQSEIFTDREFIHVNNDTDVTIENGKLLKLEDAAGKNTKLFKDGVYLIGFDTIPENVMADGDLIEVTPYIPALFEVPSSVYYERWGEVELEDGMCIRLVVSNEVSRPKWDIDSAVASFESSWKVTSIATTVGHKESTESSGKTKTLQEDTIYLLTTDADYIDISTDTDINSRIYAQRVWFSNSDTVNLKVDGFEVKNVGDVKPNTSTDQMFDGMYLVGTDIPAGTYTVNSGSAQILDEPPTLEDLADISSLFESESVYQSGSVLTLEAGNILYGVNLYLSN